MHTYNAVRAKAVNAAPNKMVAAASMIWTNVIKKFSIIPFKGTFSSNTMKTGDRIGFRDLVFIILLPYILAFYMLVCVVYSLWENAKCLLKF